MESQHTDLDRLLSEFAEISGVSLEEPEVTEKAKSLLARHGHNLNNAILDFFENGLDSAARLDPVPIENIAQAENTASGAERYESAPVHRNLQHEFHYHSFLPRFPKAPRISNNWQFELGIHASMKEQKSKEEAEASTERTEQKKTPVWWLILLVFPKAISWLFSLFRFLLGISAPSSLRRISSLKFDYDNYELGYNFEHDLRLIEAAANYKIHTSGFNQLLEESKTEYEFMLLVLVDNESFDFVEKILLAPEFSSLFNTNTGIYKTSLLYFSNINKDPEAFEVHKHYKSRSFPSLMLLGNVYNDPTVMSSMSIIFRYNFPAYNRPSTGFPLDFVLGHVKQHLRDYSPQLVTKKYDKQEMEYSRLLKEQQDEAYLESLQQDIIKKQEKQMKSKKEELEAKRVRDKMSFLQHIKTTNLFQSQVENASAAETVRVAIKMPDGRRVVQKFLKTSLVNEVYLFTETQLVELEPDVEALSTMDIEHYCQEYQFNFELIKPFPKVVLPATSESIEAFGALKSGDNILVEYIDDE